MEISYIDNKKIKDWTSSVEQSKHNNVSREIYNISENIMMKLYDGIFTFEQAFKIATSESEIYRNMTKSARDWIDLIITDTVKHFYVYAEELPVKDKELEIIK